VKRVGRSFFCRGGGLAAVALALSLVFVSGRLFAETITVTGEAAIIQGNVESAKEAALLDAFRKAVEQGVGTIIAADTIVENYRVINDTIFTKARGYVKRWEILSEYSLGDRYKMDVRCDVSSESIEEDLIALNILQEAKHKPRIMIVVSEQHLWSYVDQPASETTMISKFLEKEFKVVDQSQSEKVRKSDEMKAVLQGDDAAAAQIGLRYGAEVIIVGKAFSETGGKVYRMESARGSVEARAVRCDTAEIIAAGTAQASGADISEAVAGKKAVQQAASQLSDDLIAQIAKRWSADIVGGASVQLTINNIDFGQLASFKKALREIKGVQDIQQRSFAAKAAVLDVDYRADAERLAEELATSDFGTFTLEIVGLTANRVEMRVK
jgi:hypothetical protein